MRRSSRIAVLVVGLPAAALIPAAVASCGGRSGSTSATPGTEDADPPESGMEDVVAAADGESNLDPPPDTPIEGGAGTPCASHAECAASLVCVSPRTGQVCDLCGEDTRPCECGVPTSWPFPVECGSSADCLELFCGDKCDDCPVTCPDCVHGWCVYEVGEVVTCLCDGCA